MKKPELKVVRFNAEDVIATSSYYTFGSEIKQASNAGKANTNSVDEDYFYRVTFNGGFNDSATVDTSSKSWSSLPGYYAWFHNDAWQTNHQAYDGAYSQDIPGYQN